MKVQDIIIWSAATWPHQPAIIDEYGTLDYHTLSQQINRVQQQLLKLGVGPEQGIGVMGQNSRSFIICAFAVLGCGATVLPISHKLKQTELNSLLRDTPLYAVIFDDNSTSVIGPSGIQIDIDNAPSMHFTTTKADQNEPFIAFVPNPAFVRFSSGTTGSTKGVVLTHDAVFERIAATNRVLRLSADDAVVWVLQMAFHFFVSIVLYLRYGVTIIICPDSYPETVVDWANLYNGTLLYAAPLHYRLLAARTAGVRFKTLKLAISTSALLPRNTSESFYNRYRIPITQAFGIIEVGLPFINLNNSLEKPESIGKISPDYDAVIFDDKMCLVTDGEIGQLAVRGPGMFAAYLNPPRLRSDVLCDGWFLTGDIARQDKSGNIVIVGRCKSMINIGGDKVFPEEVEEVLDQYPNVAVSKVISQSHPQLGEIVHADIVLHEPSQNADIEEIIAYCKSCLTSFKVPQSITFTEAIKETSSGKICRC